MIRNEADRLSIFPHTNGFRGNLFSVDLEDYYMVSGFSHKVRFEDWDSFESRIERNTYGLLNILESFDVHATFFVLGWVGKKYPELVRRIRSNGHEIANHGYNHRSVFAMTPEEFRGDLRISREILEDVVGEDIRGYRAPSFSITKKSMWAIDILIEEGFRYDSSIFPIRHDYYGYPDFERFPVIIQGEGGEQILEVPLSTIRVMGQNLPCSGGGYFRLYPLRVMEWIIEHLNRNENLPVNFYLHPWELDRDQPKMNVGALRYLRHVINIDKSESRLKELLQKYRFFSFREYFNA